MVVDRPTAVQEALIDTDTSKDNGAVAIARPVLTVFRLTKDEFGVRPIALAGVLGDALASAVADAPVTTTSGTFNAFSTECTRDTQWVVSTPLAKHVSLTVHHEGDGPRGDGPPHTECLFEVWRSLFAL